MRHRDLAAALSTYQSARHDAPSLMTDPGCRQHGPASAGFASTRSAALAPSHAGVRRTRDASHPPRAAATRIWFGEPRHSDATLRPDPFRGRYRSAEGRFYRASGLTPTP